MSTGQSLFAAGLMMVISCIIGAIIIFTSKFKSSTFLQLLISTEVRINISIKKNNFFITSPPDLYLCLLLPVL